MSERDAGPWKYRMHLGKNDMAHGITYHMWERDGGQRVGEVTVADGRKINIPGTVCVMIAQGQYKYEDELVGQVFRKGEPVDLPRKADTYQRIQIYFGALDEWTVPLLRRVAIMVKEILGGREVKP